jgi:hypothetical protein
VPLDSLTAAIGIVSLPFLSAGGSAIRLIAATAVVGLIA